MNKQYFFFATLLSTAIRYCWMFVISLILTIIGSFGTPVCLYIGFALLALYLLICFGWSIYMQRSVKRFSDDPEFVEMMSRITSDPNAFLSDSMEKFDEKKQLHGQDLLKLSDDDLFEVVYFQNLDIADGAEDEEHELEQFSGARRTVYILSMFDMEIQNGGLCQFFVNSSSSVAPYVCDALNAVGAHEHRELFENFIAKNNIDVSNLESFKKGTSVRAYIKQTKRFDYETFDDKYSELPVLQHKIVAYIKDNINEF